MNKKKNFITGKSSLSCPWRVPQYLHHLPKPSWDTKDQRGILCNCRYVTFKCMQCEVKWSTGWHIALLSSHIGFPNVLGCIDSTHIQIQAPPGPVERDFVDRRNNHSLNVQVHSLWSYCTCPTASVQCHWCHPACWQMICDSELLITNIEAKWPGGVHDARILRESHLAQRLAQGKTTFIMSQH